MMFGALLAALAVATGPAHIERVDCARFAKVAEGVAVECGYLRAPEDRDVPGSRTIGVPFAIVRNARRTAEDPVIFMTGGPGGQVIPSTIRAVDPAFGGRDLVFFEQRGTALADPRLDCPGYAEEKQRAQRGEIDGKTLASRLIQKARRCVAAARNAGAALSGYTTRSIVDDLEEFRAAIGFDRINLIGLSYSGKVVAEYARDHPRRTRAVIANTPLTVEANYDEYGESAMRRSLDLVFAACQRDRECNRAYPALRVKFNAIVARAVRRPWTIAVPDPAAPGHQRSVRLTPWVAANALLNQLYLGATIEGLPRLIDAIAAGDRKSMISILDIGRSDYPWLMRMALWCNEEVPFESHARIEEDLRAYPEFGGVDQSTLPLGLCRQAGLKARPPARENSPVRSNVPFLIFSGLFDPATPPAIQQRMARTLPKSTIALFPAAGHGAGFSACGASLMGAFLTNPEGKLDISCTREKLVPAFARGN